MTAVEFGELPTAMGGRNGSEKHAEIARALKARPGEWAKVDTKKEQRIASVAAAAIKTARTAAYRPAGSFEAVTRGADIWARFVGGEQS